MEKMDKDDSNLQEVDLESYECQIQTCVNCYCGLCIVRCPAFEETKDESLTARGIAQIMDALKRGELELAEISDEVAYACTGCRWCEWNCSLNTPLWIKQHGNRITKVSAATMTEIIRSMRTEEGEIPEAIKSALDNMARVGNPYGRSRAAKDKWVEELGCKFKGEDTLLYVGSTVPYEDRSTAMVEILVSVLKKAGFSFAMIGSEEWDSGALARYMGEEGLFAELVERLKGQFDEKGIKRVICVSPHDYDAFLSYYEQNGTIQFKHYSEVLLELIENKKIEFVDKLNKRVTYHDPCYLGRKHDIYDAPREVLKSIPGLELVEMERNKELAYCCGGGGTGLWYELPRCKMNITRVDQAKERNAEYIAVTCPLCLQMLDDGVKSKNYDILVKDIVQILDEVI